MANRKIRRSNMKTNSAVRSSSIDVNGTSELDIKGYVITVTGIVIVMAIAYGLTILAKRAGLFDVRYVKPTLNSATISYESILSGTIFNRPDSEYYVMIADFDNKESIYLSSLGSLYSQKKDKLPLYSVDLSNDMNKSIIGSESNPGAQSTEDLKINGVALIKISNGRNVKFINDVESIKTELGV